MIAAQLSVAIIQQIVDQKIKSNHQIEMEQGSSIQHFVCIQFVILSSIQFGIG